MSPDYNTLLDNFIVPVLMFFLFAFGMLGWAMAIQLNKEVTDLRIRLGREFEREPRRNKLSELREHTNNVKLMLTKKLNERREKDSVNKHQLVLKLLSHALFQVSLIVLFKLIINVRSLVSVFRMY